MSVGAIEICPFLLVAAGRGVGGQCFDQPAQLPLRLIREHRESAPRGAVGGNLVRVEPVPDRIAIEIVARLHAWIAARQIDAPGADAGRWSGGLRRSGS